MAKKRFRVTAEESVVLGHKTGEEFEIDSDQTDYNLDALIASGVVAEIKAKEEKENK